MDGRVLALGGMALLAAAGAASKRGSAARRQWDPRKTGYNNMDPEIFPAFVNATTPYGGRRYSWAVPSWETAEAWEREKSSAGAKRVNIASEPSRGQYIAGVHWLLPTGDLAKDLAVRPVLGGVILIDRRGGSFRIEANKLPDEVRRRLETIEIRARHDSRYHMHHLHRAALNEVLQKACALDLASDEWQGTMDELAWLTQHPGPPQ